MHMRIVLSTSWIFNHNPLNNSMNKVNTIIIPNL